MSETTTPKENTVPGTTEATNTAATTAAPANNQLNTEELYTLNDEFTQYLANEFNWHIGDNDGNDDRADALNDLVHETAALIQRLLDEHPVEL